MDALLLLYNLLLLILYSMPALLALLLYVKRKEYLYLYIVILFGIYFIDALVLNLTDFIESFATFYHTMFLNVPTLKTLVYVVSFFCIMKIIEWILNCSLSVYLYIGFVVLTVFLLFVPGMENSLLKLYLYYFPCSLFGIIIGINAWNIYKRIPTGTRTKTQQRFRHLIYALIVFSILVLSEDIITISSYSSYTDLNQRSITEDIMSVVFSVCAFLFLVKQIEGSSTVVSTEPIVSISDSNTTPTVDVSSENTTACNETNDDSTDVIEKTETIAKKESRKEYSFSKFFLFCKHYQLTTREQDIMTLLLQRMSNEDISTSLQISLGTAKAHIHNIYIKVNVKKRAQLLNAYEMFEEVE